MCAKLHFNNAGPRVLRLKYRITDLQRNASRIFTIQTVLRLALPIVICVSAAGAVICQEPAASPRTETAGEAKPDKAKPAFTLSITNDQVIGITLRARDASLKEIAAELSKRLKIPVSVSPIMQKHVVTMNFGDLVLEPALQMLAPQVYIDYEVDTTPGVNQRPLAIYLQGYNERPPSETEVVHGNSDVMVIEGNTEDTPPEKAEAEQELKVTYEKGELSVQAKKEPLVVVLYGIANELGIPLEVKNEVTDLVTINITRTSVESTLQQLGPNIRLYLRADLQLQERRPLRLVLVGPDKKS